MIQVYLIAVFLALVRLSGHTSVPFQAMAHLFVAGLYGWYLRRPCSRVQQVLYVAIGLTVIEGAAFLGFHL